MKIICTVLFILYIFNISILLIEIDKDLNDLRKRGEKDEKQ